ncbi:caspase family protein [Aquibium sp. ELW1220]|uniref:caspase family protein n=1 Tax=Aquibium sp. ELW1220 TaxID=2976766 RepID=UPI0025B1788A|nr:caspase family protein [Aquibium sp. ELW1220]MDN2583000.1 caspase family protein [Aquibium sp. ELW1220]
MGESIRVHGSGFGMWARRSLWLCVMIAAAMTLAAKAQAARFALVIGNSAYEQAGRLPNARNDADVLAAALRQVGFEVELMHDLDQDEMGDALDRLADRAPSLEAALFYYAGHGIQHEGRNYLLPVDVRLKSERAIEREAISLESVLSALEEAPLSLIFLDACRNNPFADALAQDAIAAGRGARALQGLAVVRTLGDMLISYATLPGSVAYDGGYGNSPYARALNRHLATPDIEVSVLMKRVTRNVMEETGERQRPQQLSQMQSEFYFVRSAHQPALVDRDPTLFSAYPASVTTGDEVALFADVPSGCDPAFFDISPSRQVTPIPSHFFRTYGLSGGNIRFEVSPGSRYGLVVQEDDERGTHQIGFFCESSGALDSEAKLRLVQSLYRRLQQKEYSGAFETGLGQAVLYHFTSYEIRD